MERDGLLHCRRGGQRQLDLRLSCSLTVSLFPSLSFSFLLSLSDTPTLDQERPPQRDREREQPSIGWWGQVAAEARKGERDHRKSVCPYLRGRVNHAEACPAFRACFFSSFRWLLFAWLHAVETATQRGKNFRENHREDVSLSRELLVPPRPQFPQKIAPPGPRGKESWKRNIGEITWFVPWLYDIAKGDPREAMGSCWSMGILWFVGTPWNWNI